MSNNFFFENRAVCETMCTKYVRARQATNGDMAQALCMPDT